MNAIERNEAAKARASANPEAVAEAARMSETLALVLRRWPAIEVEYDPNPDASQIPTPFGNAAKPTEADIKRAETAWRESEANQSPEWRASVVRALFTQRIASPEILKTLVRHEFGYDSRTNASAICKHLAALPSAPDASEGLSLLALVVEEMPVDVEPETRQDKRILPRIAVSESRPERKAGMLFAGLHEGRRIHAPELPLFPEVAPAKRVPILDLVDAAGLPVMARGRGAPLPLRLFVRALASVRPEDRRRPTVGFALRLRELRDGLFPNGGWRVGKHWPELRHALMHARDYAIHDGRGRWFPVALRYMPDAPNLDDIIMLEVAFPPGSYSGPVVNLPEMDRLSVDSAARWRAYIGAHSLAWQPGTTRVPAPRAGGRYVWTRDLAAYPVLTVEDRRRLAFGAGDKKHRTRSEIDAAFRDLPGLIVLTEQAANDRTGEVGWLVLPEDAARPLQPRNPTPKTRRIDGCTTGEAGCTTGERNSPVVQRKSSYAAGLRAAFGDLPRTRKR